MSQKRNKRTRRVLIEPDSDYSSEDTYDRYERRKKKRTHRRNKRNSSVEMNYRQKRHRKSEYYSDDDMDMYREGKRSRIKNHKQKPKRHRTYSISEQGSSQSDDYETRSKAKRRKTKKKVSKRKRSLRESMTDSTDSRVEYDDTDEYYSNDDPTCLYIWSFFGFLCCVVGLCGMCHSNCGKDLGPNRRQGFIILLICTAIGTVLNSGVVVVL